MPFNTTTWVYSPTVGATSATPGALIQSAVWDNINADVATALTQLGGLRVNPLIFQTAGVTTYVASTNLVFAVIEAQGGGGGGGGAAGSAGGLSSGGGGGGGGYAYAVIPAATIGVTQAITVGVTGAGGGAGNTAGVTGGTTSFGTLVVAAGGNPGSGAGVTVAATGGSGGVGVTGQILRTGAAGEFGMAAAITTVFGPSGAGGSRPWPAASTPGVVAVTSAVTGSSALAGSGGSGGQVHATAGNAAGGNGGQGQLFVWEYLF